MPLSLAELCGVLALAISATPSWTVPTKYGIPRSVQEHLWVNWHRDTTYGGEWTCLMVLIVACHSSAEHLAPEDRELGTASLLLTILSLKMWSFTLHFSKTRQHVFAAAIYGMCACGLEVLRATVILGWYNGGWALAPSILAVFCLAFGTSKAVFAVTGARGPVPGRRRTSMPTGEPLHLRRLVATASVVAPVDQASR